MTDTLERLARRWFQEVWNEGRTSTIDELMGADARMHGLGEDLVGPAAYKQFHAAYRGAFPDLHIEIEDVLADDDRVLIRWTATGTHTGDTLGPPATHRPARFGGMSLARVQNGQIVEGWNAFDEMGMSRQLGLVP